MVNRFASAVLISMLLVGCGGGGGGNGGGGSSGGGGTLVAPTGLSYTSPVTATVGSSVTALSPTVTGTVSSYSVTPALPAGLSLNTSTGAISGTPTAAAAQTTHTVTATNAAGSTTFALVLTVNAQTAQGTFLDSVVTGLDYQSGGQSGVTDDEGRFTYEVDGTVTFKVGNVTLGTVAGRTTLTPLDLVEASSSTTTAVQNIVRFLMLMDSDGNAANGITISAGLRERAQGWPAVDFSAADFAQELVNIIPDTQVDGALRSLPDIAAATEHFEATFRCHFGGFFRGTYSGDDNGNFAFVIFSNTGTMSGAAYSVPEQELLLLNFDPLQLPVKRATAFTAGVAQGGSTFSGTFPDYDQVEGTWTDGTFSGTRYAGTQTASYKFDSFLITNGTNVPVGMLHVEMSPAGAISVVPQLVNLASNAIPSMTVQQNGNSFTASTTAGFNLNASLDKESVSLTGTWTDPQGNSGTLAGGGCRLR